MDIWNLNLLKIHFSLFLTISSVHQCIIKSMPSIPFYLFSLPLGTFIQWLYRWSKWHSSSSISSINKSPERDRASYFSNHDEAEPSLRLGFMTPVSMHVTAIFYLDCRVSCNFSPPSGSEFFSSFLYNDIQGCGGLEIDVPFRTEYSIKM